jgi:hypothetical protein
MGESVGGGGGRVLNSMMVMVIVGGPEGRFDTKELFTRTCYCTTITCGNFEEV